MKAAHPSDKHLPSAPCLLAPLFNLTRETIAKTSSSQLSQPALTSHRRWSPITRAQYPSHAFLLANLTLSTAARPAQLTLPCLVPPSVDFLTSPCSYRATTTCPAGLFNQSPSAPPDHSAPGLPSDVSTQTTTSPSRVSTRANPARPGLAAHKTDQQLLARELREPSALPD